MNRRLLALPVLALLLLTSGCLGGGLNESELSANQTYDWETNATATVTVGPENYRAVYTVSDGQPLEVYQKDRLTGERFVQISSVKFRYPNGTVVGSAEIETSRSGDRAVIDPPAASGQLAYTAPTPPKDFSTPILVEGSYEVILPPGMRIGVPLFGTIEPGGSEHSIEDDRVHLYWEEEPSGQIQLHWYLERDFYLFVGLVGALVCSAVGGVIYYKLQISSIVEKRRENDFDLEGRE